MTAFAPPGGGAIAPNCALICDDGSVRRLSEFRGSPLVVVFHPTHWDPAQAECVAVYNRLIANLAGAAGARLLSVGGEDAAPWRSLAFDDAALTIPILPIVGAEMHGESAAELLGVSPEAGGAVVVLDGDGVVRWRHDGHTSADPVALARALTDASIPAPSVSPSVSSRPRHTSNAWSRREFVATALGITFALLLEPRRAYARVARGHPAAPGAARAVTLNVNGKSLTLQLEPRVSLLDALREYAGLTGTKKGCDHGQCGACTVHVDGRRELSCLTFAVMLEGKRITTIEGVAQGDTLHPLQQAFIAHDGFQCGYCTSGQIMSGLGMMKEPWGPGDDDVREAMSGNICRCGAYPGIVAAIQAVRQGHATRADG